MKINRIKFLSLLLVLGCSPVQSNDFLVGDQQQYFEVLTKLKPGDQVVLKNGIWNDFEVLLEGRGTKEAPIILRGETNGQVILSGKSNLRMAGEYLVVKGLVFKDGYTPTNSVISFAKSKHEVANYSRVTETVIDHFNNPERFENENWVTMYGKHNRFDHNHLEGKQTKGVTFAVRLNTQASQQNYHRIDHNYFGPRQILGSNGGETLRVGTSHFSLTDSFTRIENNYFDRCDGELEIISNKAGKNAYVGNVFYQSRGTLTMRHGNDTLIENNVFQGNGAEHTGGIRVINKRQVVRNNYLEGLAGYRFGGALVIMNGVPNSKINRYHQVEDSIIANNSIVNSDHIQLAAGSDFERSAVPIRSEFSNNLLFQPDGEDPFTVYDDISGIAFSGNVINGVEGLKIGDGFKNEAFRLERASNGLLYPESGSTEVGVSRDLNPIQKNQVGVSWYPKPQIIDTFDHGHVHKVKPGPNSLFKALERAVDGDILSLAEGEYEVSKILPIDKSITIQAQASSANVSITFQRAALFELQNGGNLKLKGLTISGSEAPDSSGNSVIRTQRRSMLGNYELLIEDLVVENLDVNHSFNFLSVAKGTFADKIEVLGSEFKNISGSIFGLDREDDDFGIYNAEYLVIRNSNFVDVYGELVDFYRGGTDESTFGPHFELSASKLERVGLGKRNKSKSSVILHGVQVTSISDNEFIKSSPLKIFHTVGEPQTSIVDNRFAGTPEMTVKELYSDKENTAHVADNVYQKAY